MPGNEPHGPRVERTSPTTWRLTCVRCGRHQALQLDQLRAAQSSYITCGCGQRYRLGRVERRRFLRKRVQLPGTLLDPHTCKSLDRVTIVAVSVAGVGFHLPHYRVNVGETFLIDFRLDDEMQTLIHEPIVVRHVTADHRVGAEFTDQDGYHFDLDFYLRPDVF